MESDIHLLKTRIVPSPTEGIAVKITHTGQTDDDWYKLEIPQRRGIFATTLGTGSCCQGA